MTKENAKTKRPVVHSMNEATAKAAFEKLRPTLEAMPREGLMPIRVDVQLAAAIAHSVGIRDGAEPRRTRLQAVASSGLIDLADFDRLPSVALAVWYAPATAACRRRELRSRRAGLHRQGSADRPRANAARG